MGKSGQGYRLGVDLGTTFTSAAIVVEGSAPELLPLGRHQPQVPSVVFLSEQGEFIVGDLAEARGALEPQRTAREFKRHLGDQVPILIAGSPMSAQALQARLLAWVVEQATRLRGEPPASITVTHPATWGAYKHELLAQTIRMADVGDTATCSEPEAAATLYSSRHPMQIGECLAVYDLGAGSFDVAVVRRTGDGFEVLGRPDGLDHLGGIDFDEAVTQYVVAQLDDLDQLGDGVDLEVLTALSRLRRDCVAAKEALSTETEYVIGVHVPGRTSSITLTRDELDAMLRPAIADTIAATRRALRSAGLRAEELTAIVVTGGSSRIPLVRDQLSAAFGRPLALETEPKQQVAMGAALYGMSKPGSAAPSPEEAPREPTRPWSEPAPPPTAWHGRQPAGAGSRWLRGRRRLAVAVAALACVAAVAAGLVITFDAEGSSQGAVRPPPPAAGSSTTPQRPKSTHRTTTPVPRITLPDDSLLVTSKGKAGSIRLMRLDLGPSATTTARVLPMTGLPPHSTPMLPTVSPDRSTIVFLVRQGKKDQALTPWIMTLAGKARPLLHADSPCTTTGRPAFSPDGKRLAVICTSRESHHSSLMEIDLQGRLVGEPLVSDGSADGNPTWTTDGRIVFQRRSGADPEKLWSVPDDPAPATPTQLTTGIGWDSHEDWSNATHRLLFLRTRGSGGGGQICVSTKRGAFTTLPGIDDAQAPSWSPDGRQIAFLRREGDRLTLWLMAADGSDLTMQSVKVDHLGPPAWDSR